MFLKIDTQFKKKISEKQWHQFLCQFFFYYYDEFFTPVVVIHRSDSKSPQVSRTLLGILAELNNAIIWMVSVCPPIFNSSSLFRKSSGIVQSAPIIIGITVTFMFNGFFLGLRKVLYSAVSLSFFFFFRLSPFFKIYYR